MNMRPFVSGITLPAFFTGRSSVRGGCGHQLMIGGSKVDWHGRIGLLIGRSSFALVWGWSVDLCPPFAQFFGRRARSRFTCRAVAWRRP